MTQSEFVKSVRAAGVKVSPKKLTSGNNKTSIHNSVLRLGFFEDKGDERVLMLNKSLRIPGGTKVKGEPRTRKYPVNASTVKSLVSAYKKIG
jgi:hypothetical protein